MSTATLLKKPLRITNHRLEGRTVGAEQIVGITPSGMSTIVEYGHRLHRPVNRELEEELSLPDPTIDNLIDFYLQTRARAPESRPDYSCHTFVYYVLGKVAEIGLSKELYATDIGAAKESDDGLEAGSSYFAVTPEGLSVHSLLGINRPGFNLSVDGDRMPLRIIANQDILALYGGTILQEYRPELMSY